MPLERVVPNSLDVLLGMRHDGLIEAAEVLERSRGFKTAFLDTVGQEVGIGPDHQDMATRLPTDGTRLPSYHEAYLKSFNGEGFPPEYEIRRFVDAVIEGASPLVAAGTNTIKSAEAASACCLPTKTGWRICNGYMLVNDSQPYKATRVVERYESTNGPIANQVVRQSLIEVRVFVEVRWTVTL